MITFNLNNTMSYPIAALEKISPSLAKLKGTMQEDFQTFIEPAQKSGRVNAKDVSILISDAMQPIQYLFWSSVMLTGTNYLMVKYTPIFRSVFKVTTVASAVFTFEFFMLYFHTYKEYLYFDARSKEKDSEMEWEDFLFRVEDFSRNILASTFFISGKRFLVEDINGGILNLMKQAQEKKAPLNAQEVAQYLPGLGKWFRVEG